jgi:hypothetical protein
MLIYNIATWRVRHQVTTRKVAKLIASICLLIASICLLIAVVAVSIHVTTDYVERGKVAKMAIASRDEALEILNGRPFLVGDEKFRVETVAVRRLVGE